MIHAVLFDLDGTLIDTNELIIDSFKHTFEFFNKSIPTREDIIDCFGEPLHGTMSKFFDDGEQAVKVYREFNLKYHDERIDSYGNAKEMLKALKDKGIKLGIVTSKNKNTAIRGLKKCDLIDYFEVLVTSDDVEKHKPNKEPVLKACESLGVEPKNTLMVGDSIVDILSGKNAGSKTCGVLYSLMSEKLLKEEADYYIEDLMDLVDVVK